MIVAARRAQTTRVWNRARQRKSQGRASPVPTMTLLVPFSLYTFLIRIMNVNKLSGISEHPSKADKSAMGAINRLLRMAGLLC
jgi:hypothetical protein